jgi:uncharacterized protein YecE (DUF72 family)
MPLLVGTSGWQYDHWRRRFYPREVPVARWLEFYAERFATVESNAAFYRLPERETFETWADRTPPDFVMAVKMSRYLTHIRRLSDPEEPVKRLLSRAKGLGGKLGPVLLQLPPTLRADTGLLRAALESFPRDCAVAVEPRHESWWTQGVRGLLESAGAALCLADRAGPVTPLWRTAPWGYIRLHGGRARPPSCYGRTALASWIERIADRWSRESEVYVYFNNDGWGCAPRDASVLAHLGARSGLESGRTPDLRALTVGPVGR